MKRQILLGSLVGVLILVLTACAGGVSEQEFGAVKSDLQAVQALQTEVLGLLNEPKIGLAHLNDEFHNIKGEDLLANPVFGLAHLNDEFHTIKKLLAELSQQVESVRR